MRTSSKLLTAALAVPLLATLTTAVGGHSASAASGDPSTYLVEFTNTTDAQYLTPPNFAAHGTDVNVWHRGQPASAGVQQVAENGGVAVLAAELQAALDDAALGDSVIGTPGAAGPIAPGETISFEVTTDEQYFSVVSMIICTNDGFGGIDTRGLPGSEGRARNYPLRAYDAGTETNTELRSDLVGAPFCGEGAGSGESNPDLAENGRITRHRTIRGVGDLNPALDWQGPVGELSITKLAPQRNYTVTVENLTDGQYLTPPNFAAHGSDVNVWRRGQAASAGVQQVAENGGVPVLAAELQAAIDDAGLGVSGVGSPGANGPIAPGEIVSFDLTTDERKLSFVSMLICTNDGFAGLDGRDLPRWEGVERTFYLRGYDAGTELNTELRADLVGAPFCGEGEGSGESNPDLAENGVITPHRTLRGVGDLDAGLDWSGSVAKVTITNNG
jgi:hypothetical protein